MASEKTKHGFFVKSFHLLTEMRECVERLRHEAAENGADPEADEWYTALRDLRDNLDYACSLMNAQNNKGAERTVLKEMVTKC